MFKRLFYSAAQALGRAILAALAVCLAYSVWTSIDPIGIQTYNPASYGGFAIVAFVLARRILAGDLAPVTTRTQEGRRHG